MALSLVAGLALAGGAAASATADLAGLAWAELSARPLPALLAGTVEIHVAPDGDDTWNGRAARGGAGTTGPLRSPVAAQAQARRLLQAMASGVEPRLPVHVVLQPGLYLLAQTWVFDERDSGQPGAEVVYRAARPGTVTLSGGLPLAVAPQPDGTVTMRLPPGAQVDWRWAPQLFVDGRLATLARQPDLGRFWFVQPEAVGRRQVGSEQDAFVLDDEAQRWLAALEGTEREHAVLNLYQSWTTGRHRLGAATPTGAPLPMPLPKWPYLSFGRSQRLYVENVAAAFDAPGEWLGRGDTVRYRPRAGETATAITAVLAHSERLLHLNGTREQPVHDLQFLGLDFAHAAYRTPAAGFVDNQAASGVGAALVIDRAQRIVFDRIRVRASGGHGLWLRQEAQDNEVRDSVFDELGAGGIRIGTADADRRASEATAGNRVTSSIVTQTGRVWPAGVGIWLGRTWGNAVSGNLVADTTYTGISVGWKWGFGEPLAGRNRIERNVLLNIGQAVMSDLGGIYTLGESPGTVIKDNLIRNVRAYPEYGPGGRAGAWGIYHDEGSSDMVVEDNVVVGTDSGGYHLHFGRGNRLRSNLLAHGEQAEFRVSKPGTSATAVTAEANLLVPLAAQPTAGLAAPPVAAGVGNRLVEPARQGRTGRTRCEIGCDPAALYLRTGPSLRDVTVLDPAGGVAAGSWRATIESAGPDLGSLSAVLAVAETAPAALRPTAAVRVVMAGAVRGALPPGLSVRPTDDPDAIGMDTRPGATGPVACLSFNDGPMLKNRFEPMAFVAFGRTTGRWTSRFRLWLDEGAQFQHEWRDDETPFAAGPSLSFEQGEVRVGGATVARVPVRQWIGVEVSAESGAPGSRWTLALDLPDGRRTVLVNLAPRSPGWRGLRWAGFVSNAISATRSCVADIAIAPSVR